MSQKSYKIFLVAGESSGDFIGAKLMAALKNTEASFRFMGVGGDQMFQKGLKKSCPSPIFPSWGF